MGILRADRIAGLGGANAIKGSVEFRADQNIHAEIVDGNADFNYGSGDFTIECWWNSGGDLSTDINFVTLWNYSSSRQAWGMYWDADDGNFGLIASTGGDIGSTDITYRQAAGFEKNRWYHLAIVRISNTLTLYKDGTSIGSNSSFTGTIYENTVDPLIIGGQMDGTSESAKIMRGFISNLRIIKGEGIYTGNFTPPTNELTVTPNTVLLACQSPGDILQEATGKKLIAYRRTTNSSFPIASRFTPDSPVGFSTTTDVGSQYGAVFNGFSNFATSTYMVPPAGNTRERNRGRGIIAGGARSPYKDIEVIDIASEGNGQDFGDLNTAASLPGSASSSTRMLVTGMGTPSNTNIIEFITIANIASSEDFGDLTVARRRTQSLSNSTRGVHVAGSGASPLPYHNTIDYNAIATAGNSIDFGDTSASTVTHGGSVASSTRGIYDAAFVSPSYVNSIEYITIASTGNGQDFGDLSQAKGYRVRGSICDTTRGLFAGGYNPVQDTIEFVTMATLGNSTDFGNLTVARRGGGGTSNSIKSIFAGGYLPGTSNVIDAVVIQTTGNAKDFGDLLLKSHDSSGSSDSHGGLS